jgi:hypothetical protein
MHNALPARDVLRLNWPSAWGKTMRRREFIALGHEPINLPGERLMRSAMPPMADVLLHSSETTRCAIT